MYNQKPLSGDLLDYGDPLTQGLVGYWLLNEGSGNKVFDLSGNGNAWTIVGATWRAGKFGTWLYFDGDDYITIPSTVFNYTTGFTISFWAQKAATATRYSIMGGSLSNNYQRLSLMEFGAQPLYLETDTDGDVAQANIGDDLLLHHYAVTCIGGAVAMYKDGVALAMADATISDNLTVNRIGNANGSEDFVGNLDNFSFYNRALSSSEIALLYRGPFRMIRTRKRRIIYDGVEVAPPTSFPYYYREIASRRIA